MNERNVWMESNEVGKKERNTENVEDYTKEQSARYYAIDFKIMAGYLSFLFNYNMRAGLFYFVCFVKMWTRISTVIKFRFKEDHFVYDTIAKSSV